MRTSDLRIVGEIQCPDFHGGYIYPERKSDFCELREQAREIALKHGCTITFRAEPKSKARAQGSLFEKKVSPQRQLFGRIRRRGPTY